jgi:hypothetical protein
MDMKKDILRNKISFRPSILIIKDSKINNLLNLPKQLLIRMKDPFMSNENKKKTNLMYIFNMSKNIHLIK